MSRLIIDIFLVLAVFIFPWWLVFLGAVIALFFFPSYYEILFLGIMIDSLYNAPSAGYLHFQFVVTMAAVGLFIGAEVLKRRLRIFGDRHLY